MSERVKNMISPILRPLFSWLYADEIFMGQKVTEDMAVHDHEERCHPRLVEAAAIVIAFLSNRGSFDGDVLIEDLSINGHDIGRWRLNARKELRIPDGHALDVQIEALDAIDLASRLRVYAAISTSPIRLNLTAAQARSLARHLDGERSSQAGKSPAA